MNRANSFDPSLTSLRVAPAQYVNREGVIQELGHYVSSWGNRAFISGGKRALAAVGTDLMRSLEKSKVLYEKHLFTGECCPENVTLIKSKAVKFKANVIIGVGGGKSLDAAKAAAAELEIPVVCIPTIAATCSATTAMSVMYTQKGTFVKAQYLPRNPSLVLVDPAVIAHAPVLYLQSGILDSMAKWFEGRAVIPGIKDPDVFMLAAIHLAEVLYQGFRKYAIEAASYVSRQTVHASLVQVVDLVIFLTGIVQSLAKGTLFSGIAHAINNGLTALEEAHPLLHGIKVGYGILVQLYVEKGPNEEFEDVYAFFRQLDLKPSFKGLNLPFRHEAVMRVAGVAASDPYMGPVTYPVTQEVLVSAMEALEKKANRCVDHGGE